MELLLQLTWPRTHYWIRKKTKKKNKQKENKDCAKINYNKKQKWEKITKACGLTNHKSRETHVLQSLKARLETPCTSILLT